MADKTWELAERMLRNAEKQANLNNIDTAYDYIHSAAKEAVRLGCSLLLAKYDWSNQALSPYTLSYAGVITKDEAADLSNMTTCRPAHEFIHEFESKKTMRKECLRVIREFRKLEAILKGEYRKWVKHHKLYRDYGDLVSVYENSGDYESMMENAAGYIRKSPDRALVKAGSAIEMLCDPLCANFAGNPLPGMGLREKANWLHFQSIFTPEIWSAVGEIVSMCDEFSRNDTNGIYREPELSDDVIWLMQNPDYLLTAVIASMMEAVPGYAARFSNEERLCIEILKKYPDNRKGKALEEQELLAESLDIRELSVIPKAKIKNRLGI